MKRIDQIRKDAKVRMIPPSPMMKKLGYGTGVSVYVLPSSLQQCLSTPTKQPSSIHFKTHKSPWAVKKVNSNNPFADKAAERLKLEADILKTLQHPNIIGYRGVAASCDRNKTYTAILMEKGEMSLATLLEELEELEMGPLPASDILHIVKEVSHALAYLHSCKWLHGDIKSANILIKRDFSKVQLCDFGVAVRLDENMHALGEYIGTEAWSAPEVLDCDGEEADVTHKADIYSLGMVIYEMLTLQMPHFDALPSGDNDNDDSEYYYSQLGTRPKIPDDLLDESYNRVLEVFYLCSEPDKEKRPSAQQLLQLLEEND